MSRACVFSTPSPSFASFTEGRPSPLITHCPRVPLFNRRWPPSNKPRVLRAGRDPLLRIPPIIDRFSFLARTDWFPPFDFQPLVALDRMMNLLVPHSIFDQIRFDQRFDVAFVVEDRCVDFDINIWIYNLLMDIWLEGERVRYTEENRWWKFWRATKEEWRGRMLFLVCL